ncbi:hypothetical protein B0H17DRAFT_942495 [Mycena rosella]|uniref:Uncharacterized protein n=1 Tax=Mycena rosella TaxID=1033263 RepID=A0AAD7DAI6_MYCRO|nr:hypothetical protein B0H17DRAFT_942495 [Mycena rosella]
MPGPSNTRKHQKNGKKRSKPRLSIESTSSSGTYASESTASSSSSQHIRTPPPLSPGVHSPRLADEEPETSFEEDTYVHGLPQKPFIHDPGNGQRVRDMRAFLTSPFNFAQPPALDDPLCAEFSQNEVLQMLCTVLPEETALILWYNKSRSTSRICPACQRLYHLGDVLRDHLEGEDEHARVDQRPPPQLEREQEISGLCSTMCFILASYNYPAAIKSAWGHTAEEMDDEAWALLNSSGEGHATTGMSVGLGMLVRMTRLHDLGLAQLCLPDVDFDEEIYSD